MTSSLLLRPEDASGLDEYIILGRRLNKIGVPVGIFLGDFFVGDRLVVSEENGLW